ncbi:MAG: hypothetical protein SVK08_01435 [Halobacteriota archaeon]|nr:hypothetical protein [Halobacteriota archaeon]
MSTNYFSKQNYETFTVAANFTNVMNSDETIVLASSDVVAEDKDGNDVSDTVLVSGSKAVDGFNLKIRVQAGTAASSPYKITYKAVTNVGEQYEVDQFMEVEEK